MVNSFACPSISERIADFTYSLNYEDIPDSVLAHGRLLILDTLGVALSCKDLPYAQALFRALGEMGSAGESSLFGRTEKLGLADAILYNASLIHGIDYDDTHVGGIVHPSAAVVSTALAVGEHTGASGRDIVSAIVLGWEIIIRLGMAAKGRFHDRGFHGTGIVAPFAAACVAARLMALPRDTLVNALGICGSQAAALQEFLNDGTLVKKIHPGWAGHSAIYSLAMARQGISGPKKVFEGGFGLWTTHLGGSDGLDEAIGDFGKVWHTAEVAVKLYPVCHMTHSFIDCMLELKEEYAFRAEDVAEIECRIEPRCYHIVCEPIAAKTRPRTDYMMRFSLPYVISMALLAGRVSPWEIDSKHAADPSVQAVMDKVRCVSDATKANPGYFPGWVRITLMDGRTFEASRQCERGTTGNPIGVEDIIKKFHDNLSLSYGDKQAELIKDLVSRLDQLESISPLIDALVACNASACSGTSEHNGKPTPKG